MKTKIPHLIVAGILGTALASQASLIIEDANANRIYTTAQDGVGNSLSEQSLNVGTKSNGAGWDLHAGYAFQMTGASAADLLTADFSVSMTGGQGTPIYDVDVYANRVASTSEFLVSDFEDGTKLMDDFVTIADVGNLVNYSLDSTGQANLFTYLQNNWVEDQYVFITLKANTDPAPFVMGEDSNANYIFGTSLGGDLTGTDALLTVTAIPEPSSVALLGLGLSLLFLRRRRS